MARMSGTICSVSSVSDRDDATGTTGDGSESPVKTDALAAIQLAVCEWSGLTQGEFKKVRPQMLAFLISVTLWLGCIGAGAVLGAHLSFYSGERSQLPKWNGWDYLLFSAKESAILCGIFGIPIAVIAFCMAWFVASSQSSPQKTATGNDDSSVSSEKSSNS